MALLMPVPFDEEQFNMITGANDRSNFYLEDDVETPYQEDAMETGDQYPYTTYSSMPRSGAGWAAEALGTPVDLATSVANLPGQAIGAAEGLWKGQAVEPPYQITDPVGGRGWWGDKLGERRTETGLITQAETAPQPTSVAEAQARGEKTFWSNGQEKLAVTAEQLQAFKNSDAYDPTSGQNALTQWSNAWGAPQPVSEPTPQRGVRDILIEEEGLSLTPYPDPGGGRTTVGIGHQLGAGEEAKDVTEAEARQNLETDIQKAYDSVDRLAEKFDIDGLQPELRDELMMMAFQMGATGLSKFKKMWAGIKNQDWNEVVAQMADSRWAKSQTPERAARTINRVATLLGV